MCYSFPQRTNPSHPVILSHSTDLQQLSHCPSTLHGILLLLNTCADNPHPRVFRPLLKPFAQESFLPTSPDNITTSYTLSPVTSILLLSFTLPHATHSTGIDCVYSLVYCLAPQNFSSMRTRTFLPWLLCPQLLELFEKHGQGSQSP